MIVVKYYHLEAHDGMKAEKMLKYFGSQGLTMFLSSAETVCCPPDFM